MTLSPVLLIAMSLAAGQAEPPSEFASSLQPDFDAALASSKAWSRTILAERPGGDYVASGPWYVIAIKGEHRPFTLRVESRSGIAWTTTDLCPAVLPAIDALDHVTVHANVPDGPNGKARETRRQARLQAGKTPPGVDPTVAEVVASSARPPLFVVSIPTAGESEGWAFPFKGRLELAGESDANPFWEPIQVIARAAFPCWKTGEPPA